MIFKIFLASEKGARAEQQDAAQVFERAGKLLAVVCDGAGGHRGGSDASNVAMETARAIFGEANGIFDNPKIALERICFEADKKIKQLGESPKLSPKSTIVILYTDGRVAHWAHVGDSRLYWIRNGKIAERTRDHSMVQILFEQGEVMEDEMGTHADQGRLLRALGSSEELKVTHAKADVIRGDGFLLCSDGFWERMKSQEIEAFFQQKPTADKLQAMVEEAVRRNGPKGDNTTAIAVAGGDSRQWRLFDILLIICALLTGSIAAFIFFPFVRDVASLPKLILDFFEVHWP
jgi:serine/threonine protein phosphatase PrpC